MDNILSLLGRFIVIILGYCCAAFAASVLLNVIFFAEFIVNPPTKDRIFQIDFDSFFNSGTVIISFLIATFAALPSFCIIFIGEYYNKRESLYYTLSGLGVALLTTIYLSNSNIFIIKNIYPIMIFASAGITGGFVYWLVAGRWSNLSPRKSSTE